MKLHELVAAIRYAPSPPLTPKAKAKKRAPSSKTAEQKRADWLERLRVVGIASAAKQEHTRHIASLPPMPDPRATLLAEALAGDTHAQWRADELYGAGWRSERTVEA